MKFSVKGQIALRFFQIAALAAIFTMALPMRADDRGVKSKVAPIYPDIARRMHVEGTVSVMATVDASGNVTAAKAVSGNGLLVLAAEDAVRKWKFEAGSGESKVKVDVDFNFSN